MTCLQVSPELDDKGIERSTLNSLEVLHHKRYWENVASIEKELVELQPKLDDMISLLEEIQLPEPMNIGLDPTDTLDIGMIDEAAFCLYYLRRLSRAKRRLSGE